MPLVVGIDEAGYGPTLGPLVVAASLWNAPADRVESDFWSALAPAIHRPEAHCDSALTVGDSKAVFDRSRGICSLERAVLAFAHALGADLNRLDHFLEWLGCAPHRDSALPWYRGLSHGLPLDPIRSAFGGVSARLSTCMSTSGIECCGLRAAVVPEDVFNERVRATRNKATLVVEQVLCHVAAAGRAAKGRDLWVFVDRLGGRAEYRRLLQQAFPDRHVHELEVTDTRSAYRLASADSDWHIKFVVDADRLRMPVALASMVAKYVREALMLEFNRFWRSRAPQLSPTAGYYTDAQRFLRDIATHVSAEGLATAAFMRLK